MTLDDIGFSLPSDPTLNPRILPPQIIKIESLASFDTVGITSFGRGFSVPPILVVLDGKTNKQVIDVDLKVTLGNSTVEILKNTDGMSNVTPTIIPTQSSAGVGINTVGFNTITETVTATFSVGFSTVSPFPFAVGDKVLVEGISVGVGSTGLDTTPLDMIISCLMSPKLLKTLVVLEVLLIAWLDYSRTEVSRNFRFG